ncbi:MAG: transaldolase [Anaerolineae bacterium]|jgi:transaldolase
MSKLDQLAELGQSIWLDFIRRSLITSGELKALLDEGVRGVTSNPTILNQAIAGSNDYDRDVRRLAAEKGSLKEIYEALALEDIGNAADILRPVYDRTGGLDGYVSLEVSPRLAHDTGGTIDEARRLFGALGRPNVMIKVPATPAGIPAIETLIGDGININVTLIFSLQSYRAVIDAYLTGLEKLAASGGDPSRVASVASFFISRIDTSVDRQLDALQAQDPDSPLLGSLKGKIAIARAKAAYALFKESVAGERWKRLAARGARVQRPLWASTSTKNPAYPDTMYVDLLIGPHTVNTTPPVTLDAFRDHGTVALTIEDGLDESREQLAQLAELGVDLEAITQDLLDDGVAGFAASFDSLLSSIRDKIDQLGGTGI